MQEGAIIKDDSAVKIAEALDIAWANVFKVINHFISQHDQFGFKLIEEKIDPSIEDMLLSLKVMGAILNILDGALSIEASEQRMLINAKQQIILFEQATLAVKGGDEAEYLRVVELLRTQAQF